MLTSSAVLPVLASAFAQCLCGLICCATSLSTRWTCGPLPCLQCARREPSGHAECLSRKKRAKAIRVDAVRQLVDFIGQTAQAGWRKVIVLHSG